MRGFCFLAILAVTAFAAMPINQVYSWGAMAGAYPKGWSRLDTYSYMGHPELDKMPAYANTCVARFTVMLLRMGKLSTTDPSSQGRETAIRDGKKYPMYLRVSDIKQYLTAPSINLKDAAQSGSIVRERGIIIFQGCNFGQAAGDNGMFAKRDIENSGGGGVTEHIDLWDCQSQSCLGNGDACRGYIRHCSTVLLFRSSEGCSRPTEPIPPIPPVPPKIPPPKWDVPPVPTLPPSQTQQPTPAPKPTPPPGVSFETLETHFDYGIKFGELQKCMINYELEKIDSKCQESCINVCWPQYVHVDTKSEVVELNKELKITLEKMKQCKPEALSTKAPVPTATPKIRDGPNKGKRDLFSKRTFMDPQDNAQLEPDDPDWQVNVIKTVYDGSPQMSLETIPIESDFTPKPFKHPVKDAKDTTVNVTKLPPGKRPERPKLDQNEEEILEKTPLGKPRRYTHKIKLDEVPVRQPQANPHTAVVDLQTRKVEEANLEIEKKATLEALLLEQKKGTNVEDKKVQELLERYKKAEKASSSLELKAGQDGLGKCLLDCTSKCAVVVTKDIASEQAGGRNFRAGNVQTQGEKEITAKEQGAMGFIQNAANAAGIMIDVNGLTPEQKAERKAAQEKKMKEAETEIKFQIEGDVGADGKKKLDGAKWQIDGHKNGKDFHKEGVIERA